MNDTSSLASPSGGGAEHSEAEGGATLFQMRQDILANTAEPKIDVSI